MTQRRGDTEEGDEEVDSRAVTAVGDGVVGVRPVGGGGMNAAMPLFDGTLPAGMNDSAAKVAKIIHAHKGKANRITVAEILDRLGRPKTKTQEIEIRHTVAELCADYELPIIGVRTGGYFWAETQDECIEGALPLFNQGVKMIRRARRLMPGGRYRQELYRAKLEAL